MKIVCLDNGNGYYRDDLIIGKEYNVSETSVTVKEDIAIIDESGETYIYPRDWFKEKYA